MKNLKKIAILASIYKALHKIEVQNSGYSTLFSFLTTLKAKYLTSGRKET